MTCALPFMFLGGRLDHATRALTADGPLMTPPEEYTIPVREPHKAVRHLYPDAPAQRYLRQRVTTGWSSWWVFVLEGYAPSRGELLDANPYPIS